MLWRLNKAPNKNAEAQHYTSLDLTRLKLNANNEKGESKTRSEKGGEKTNAARKQTKTKTHVLQQFSVLGVFRSQGEQRSGGRIAWPKRVLVDGEAAAECRGEAADGDEAADGKDCGGAAGGEGETLVESGNVTGADISEGK